MFYLPPGSMMQLMDGRVLHKDNKTNLWHDNMGVPITEQQLHFMVSFPSFSADATSGGDTPTPTATPAGPSTSLSAPFDDILSVDSFVEVLTNTVTVNTTEAGPVDIYAIFSGGLYGINSEFNVYLNGAIQLPVIAIDTQPPDPGTPGDPIFLISCDDGDQLQFGVSGLIGLNLLFDVTIQKRAPGEVVNLDTFNVNVIYNS